MGGGEIPAPSNKKPVTRKHDKLRKEVGVFFAAKWTLVLHKRKKCLTFFSESGIYLSISTQFAQVT